MDRLEIPAATDIRVSTGLQECSLLVQEEAIHQYPDQNNFSILASYCDKARSGLTAKSRVSSQLLDVYSKTWWDERVDAVTRVVEAVMTEPEKKEENDVTPQKRLRKRGCDELWEPFWVPQALGAD